MTSTCASACSAHSFPGGIYLYSVKRSPVRTRYLGALAYLHMIRFDCYATLEYLLTCVDEEYQVSAPWVYMTKSQLLLDVYTNVMKNLKDLSTGLKRCSALPDGTPVSDFLVAKFMYWELACGRALMLSDWRQEYTDRCTSTYHITTKLYRRTNPLVGVKRLRDI